MHERMAVCSMESPLPSLPAVLRSFRFGKLRREHFPLPLDGKRSVCLVRSHLPTLGVIADDLHKAGGFRGSTRRHLPHAAIFGHVGCQSLPFGPVIERAGQGETLCGGRRAPLHGEGPTTGENLPAVGSQKLYGSVSEFGDANVGRGPFGAIGAGMVSPRSTFPVRRLA
jgi:hypothetical protein